MKEKEIYLITTGEVEEYSINKSSCQRLIPLYYIFYFSLSIFAVLSTGIIFSICIDEKSLSETIALGSIFATFGSSVVSVFSIVMNNQSDRFMSNIEILYSDIIPEKKWVRWSFIKRKKYRRLYNGEYTCQALTNSKVEFDVGSHKISMFIPTVREDFFDLPVWRPWLSMKIRHRDYETAVLGDNVKENVAIAIMLWNCIYDNFKCIIMYRIARALVVLGEAYILSSIVFAFTYNFITHF